MKKHIDQLNLLIKGMPVEGHICRIPEMLPKRKNLYHVASQSSRALEIGFNAGHSAVHFLVANPNLGLLCFDIGTHKYVDICYNYLRQQFGNRIELIKGDSTVTVKKYIEEHPGAQFDCLHIDGCHKTEVASQDLDNCMTLAKKGAIIILDDTNYKNLADLWQVFLTKGLVNPIDLSSPGFVKTVDWHHNIARKL